MTTAVPDVGAMKSIWAKYSVGDPEWQHIQPTIPPMPTPLPDVYVLRAESEYRKKLRKSTTPSSTPLGLTVEEREISVNNTTISIRIYTPSKEEVVQDGEESFYPLLCYFHGGGFAIGDLDSADPTCREICLTNNIVVINVDYRLSPEFPFPYGLMDCYETVKWGIQNAKALNIDVTRGVLVGGISSGGNFAASITLIARDDPEFGEVPITGQLLQHPPTCAEAAYPAKYKKELAGRYDLAHAPILNLEMLRYFDELIRPANNSMNNPADPRISVVLAESHKDLPPAYIQVSGLDPLRDEGLLYRMILDQAEVKTKLDIYRGVPHSFATVAPGLKASGKWREDMAKGIEWLLNDAK